MMSNSGSMHLFLSLLALFAVTGCKDSVKISEITSHPEEFDGKSVMLDGTVTAVPLVTDNDPSKGGSFVVYDCTGNIRVITEKYMPVKYDCVDVYGKVQVTPNADGAAPSVVIVGNSAPKPAGGHIASGPLPKEWGN